MSTLPDGWRTTPIGEACEIVNGSTPKTGVPENWGGDIPWVTPDDLSGHRGKYISQGRRNLTRAGYDSCSTKMVPAGSVLFTSRAPIGYVAIASRPVCTNQGFKVFVPRSGEIDSGYLYWYLKHSTPEIREMGSGTTFLEISKRKAESIPLVIPPLDDQRRIVAAIEEQFSRLDAGTNSLTRARRNLSRMRAAVLEGLATGLLTEDLSLALDGSKSTSRGALDGTSASDGMPYRLPVGWAWSALGDVADCQGGITKNPARRPRRHTLPFLRVANVMRGSLDLADVHQIEIFESDLNRFLLESGDLLVVEGNGSPDQIGRSALWRAEIDPCVHQNHLIRVRPGPSLDSRYLSLFWNAPSSIARIRAVSSSTSGLYTLSVGKVRKVLVAVPPLQAQRALVERAETLLARADELVGTLGRQERRSANLRRAILTHAMSGRLVEERSR